MSYPHYTTSTDVADGQSVRPNEADVLVYRGYDVATVELLLPLTGEKNAVTFKNLSAGRNSLVLHSSLGIDGQAYYSIYANNSATVFYNGSEWIVSSQ